MAIKCIDKAKVGEKVAMLQEEVNILSKVRSGKKKGGGGGGGGEGKGGE